MMKKFLNFIWLMFKPAMTLLLQIFGVMIVPMWVITLFGLLTLTPALPTPMFIQVLVVIVDLSIVLYYVWGHVKEAYLKIYKK
jgi:hypothetical protein